MAEGQQADEVVVLPLWIGAVLDQMSTAERDSVEAALRHFATSGDRTALKVVSDADPTRQNGTLYELRVGAGIRVLLLQQSETPRYDVVGINRRVA